MAPRSSTRFASQSLYPAVRQSNAIRDGRRVLSVRTENLPAGLLSGLEGGREAVIGLTGSQYHLRFNVSWPGKKLLVLRCGERNSLPD